MRWDGLRTDVHDILNRCPAPLPGLWLSTILGGRQRGSTYQAVVMQSPAAAAPPGTSGASRACRFARRGKVSITAFSRGKHGKEKSGERRVPRGRRGIFRQTPVAQTRARLVTLGAGCWCRHLGSLFGLEFRPRRGRLRRMAPGNAILRTASRSLNEKCRPTPNINSITPISAS